MFPKLYLLEMLLYSKIVNEKLILKSDEIKKRKTFSFFNS